MNSTKALKSLRGKKMKTQQEVADLLGVSRQVYNSYENDTTKCELDLISKILNVLDANDLEIDDFLNGLKQDFMSYKNLENRKKE